MKVQSLFTWYDLDHCTKELKDIQGYTTEEGHQYLKCFHDTREEAMKALEEFITEDNLWRYDHVDFYLVETFTITR